ncbi:uncharacterized protein LOC111778703 [Cucurbita pepo subsp. pepo]|uniref:uncharacterized protein LOC111778703 n=1 Tax=Cucurbita pepo subsp. pepo TaxID=3664 RepID=UPI000C9D5820|nr:uncharacterized protein LOC111778703 [Cucurbita pepo subsp. pepo]
MLSLAKRAKAQNSTKQKEGGSIVISQETVEHFHLGEVAEAERDKKLQKKRKFGSVSSPTTRSDLDDDTLLCSNNGFFHAVLVVAARTCPLGIEATVFPTLMSYSNGGSLLGSLMKTRSQLKRELRHSNEINLSLILASSPPKQKNFCNNCRYFEKLSCHTIKTIHRLPNIAADQNQIVL